MIKGSCMGLEKNDVPTGIVKIRYGILCNFFCHLYENNIRGIITWSCEGLL